MHTITINQLVCPYRHTRTFQPCYLPSPPRRNPRETAQTRPTDLSQRPDTQPTDDRGEQDQPRRDFVERRRVVLEMVGQLGRREGSG